MNRKLQMSLTSAVVLAVVFLLAQLQNSLAAPTFTGNAAADFTGLNAIRIADRDTPDVGLPQTITGTISGFDMQAFYLEYDAATDTMYIGIDCFTICGDADGDGNPGGTSAALANLGGEDIPEFGPGEAFGLLIDTDNDYTTANGDFDVVIGVRDDDTLAQIGAFEYTGLISEELVNVVWGNRLPNPITLFQSPSATAPDLEFTIANFSTLPGFPAGQLPLVYQLHLGMGSLVDDGIAEDYAPDQNNPVGITPTATPTETPTATEPPTLTATAVPSDTPTLTPQPSPTVTNTPEPSPTASPTPPPPTEVPETGAQFATYQEWQAAQAPANIAVAAQPASASVNNIFHLTIPTIELATEVFARGWTGVQQADGTVVSKWDDVQYAAGWHKNSAAPGRQGNIVVSGHSNIYGSIFRKLAQVKTGQSIYIDQGRVRYTYIIDEVTLAQETAALPAQQAQNAAYLYQTDDNRLTLITCWPWNDSTHRVFVVAKLKNIQMVTANN